MANTTCWTVIRGAVEGRDADRDDFARRYLPLVRAYLAARWRKTPLADHVEDGTQEAFVDLFRDDGALSRADPSRPGGFRAFLYGVVRNVALRVERAQARRRVRPATGSFEWEGVPADEESLSAVFDRLWATALLQEAAARQRERAAERGDGARKRVELLRLRFEENLPIREIARLWTVDPAKVHHDYARAREEFLEALRDVVAFHHGGRASDVDEECGRLMQAIR